MENNKIEIGYNKIEIWNLFKKEFLNNNWKIRNIAKELNIHKGTINRWIFKKEVPPQYFNNFNRILNNKYKLKVEKIENYKIMDQFFTPETVAKDMIHKTFSFIKSNWKDINLNNYTIIEPSAGDGVFFHNFPEKYEKIGLDLDPKARDIIKKDWFDFEPISNKNIVIGNPPFGLRGQLALKFINQAAKFSDFICFILPPLFNSNGKGSPMLRINKNFYLAKEFKIKDNNFNYPNGTKVKINAIFQIWTKKTSLTVKPISPPNKKSEWIKIYSLSNGKTSSSKRNVQMIGKCDYYLPSTTYSKISGSFNFNDLPNKRGYGIIIKKNIDQIIKIIQRINWNEVCFKSTNSARNLRTQIIIDEIEKRTKW